MSKNSATVIKDGQLAVATVPQTGTLVGAASEIDATALVETADGPQLCVKTFDLNGGGGGGGTVDQTYDPTSTNAQSGTAVAEAVQPYLKNKTTASNSLLLSLKEPTSATGTNSVIITNSTATSIDQSGSYSVSIGNGYSINNSIVSIGYSASAQDDYCIAIGRNSTSQGGAGAGKSATAIGNYASSLAGTAIGAGTRAQGKAIALGVGNGTSTIDKVKAEGRKSIVIGVIAETGEVCEATANEAIQLGNGANANAKTFQVYTYQLLDGNTGLIPAARIGTGYDATKTQVLKNVNGTLTWVDE